MDKVNTIMRKVTRKIAKVAKKQEEETVEVSRGKYGLI